MRRCPACDAPVEWLTTVHHFRRLPFDLHPVPADTADTERAWTLVVRTIRGRRRPLAIRCLDTTSGIGTLNRVLQLHTGTCNYYDEHITEALDVNP